MNQRIRILEPVPSRRTVVISDVHGNSSRLKALLNKVLRPQDLVIFLGDMTEKGPDSLGTIRLIMELCLEGRALAVLGNCDFTGGDLRDKSLQDEALLKYMLFRKNSLICEMCRELNINVVENMDVSAMRKELLREFSKELEFLDGLPYIIEAGQFRFVHAGLNSDDPGEWNLRQCLKLDNFMARAGSFSKYVVVGHWPTTLYNRRRLDYNPVVDRERHIISIDGANVIHEYGQLNALIIENLNDPDCLSWSYEDGFPNITALESRPASTDSRAVYYEDALLPESSEGGFTSCRLSDGYKIEVPTEKLWEKNGQVYCGGISDYCIETAAGGHYSLVLSVDERHLLKKDGICGWYDGPIER
ncbi:MAG: metallophosphoesterase [Oscillospiraceae bacterium]